MKTYHCVYVVLYGYEDGIKDTHDDYIDVESDVKPTKQEIIETLKRNNLLPKLLLLVDVIKIEEIEDHTIIQQPLQLDSYE